MNDEMEQFEQRLRRQPVKPIPAGWRAEILLAAQHSQADHQVSHGTRHSLLSAINHQLSALLWPHPKAWAGLAAVWIFIFILNFSMRDQAPALAKRSAPPSPEVVAELQQQRKMLAELIGSTQLRVADRQPVFSPKPRSERVDFLAA